MKNILVALCCSCIFYASYNIVFADEPVYRNYSVTVVSGETLWEIAGRHTEPQEDVREVMHRISKANNLKSKFVYPGQVLKIPMRIHDDNLMMAHK